MFDPINARISDWTKFLLVADLSAVVISWILASPLRSVFLEGDPWPLPDPAVGPIAAGMAALLIHHFAKSGTEPILHALAAGKLGSLVIRQCVVVALGGVSFIALSRDFAISRALWLIHLAVLPACLFLLKLGALRVAQYWVAKRSKQNRVLIFGHPERGSEWRTWFARHPWLGFQVCCSVPVEEALRGYCPDDQFDSLLRELAQKIIEGSPSLVLCGLSMHGDQLAAVKRLVERHGAHLMLDLHSIVGINHGMALRAGVLAGVVGFHQEPLSSPVNRFIKRSFDIAVSLPVVLFILPPLSLAVWILQKMVSPGPLFFVQERGGFGGSPFRIFKFRSMHVFNPDESAQARPGDLRCYPGGALLRKLSLDEFPQFLNVLLGTMSLIGPRPHMLSHDLQFSSENEAYRMRQRIKPGITGLAQIQGWRGPLDSRDELHGRISADLDYAENWTLWLDLRILVRTVWHVFSFHRKSC